MNEKDIKINYYYWTEVLECKNTEGEGATIRPHHQLENYYTVKIYFTYKESKCYHKEHFDSVNEAKVYAEGFITAIDLITERNEE